MSNNRHYENGINGNYNANGNGYISTDNDEEDLDIREIGGGARMPNFQSREVLPPHNSPRSSPTFHNRRDIAADPPVRPEEPGPSNFDREQRSATTSSTSSSRMSPISVDTSYDGPYGGQPFTMQSNNLLARVPTVSSTIGIHQPVPTRIPSYYFPYTGGGPGYAVSSESGTDGTTGGFSSPGGVSYSSGTSSSGHYSVSSYTSSYPQHYQEPYAGLYPGPYPGGLPVPGPSNSGDATSSDTSQDFRTRPDEMDPTSEYYQYRAARAPGGPTAAQLARQLANAQYESVSQQQQQFGMEPPAALPEPSNVSNVERPASLPIPGPSNVSGSTDPPARPPTVPESAMQYVGNYQGPFNYFRPDQIRPGGVSRNYTRNPPYSDTDGSSSDSPHPRSQASHSKVSRPLHYQSVPYQSYAPVPDARHVTGYTTDLPANVQPGSDVSLLPRQQYMIVRPEQIQYQPQVPQVPQISQVPQVPQMSQVPQVPQISQVPQIPQMSQVPQVPQMSQVQQISQVPQMSQVPQISHVPQMSQIQQISQVPQIPQIQQTQPVDYHYNDGNWTMAALLHPHEYLNSRMHPNVYRWMYGQGSRSSSPASASEYQTRSPMEPCPGNWWQSRFPVHPLVNENVIRMFSNMSVSRELSLQEQYQRAYGANANQMVSYNPNGGYQSGYNSRSSSMSIDISSSSSTGAVYNKRGSRGRYRRGGRGGRARVEESSDDSTRRSGEAGGEDGGEGTSDAAGNSDRKGAKVKNLPKNLPRRKSKNTDETPVNPYHVFGRMRASASPEMDVSIKFLTGLLSDRYAIECEVIDFKNFFADFDKTASPKLLKERLRDFSRLYSKYETVQEQIELFVSEDPVVDEMERSKFDAVYLDILSRVTGHIRDYRMCARERRALDLTRCMHWPGHSLLRRDNNPEGALPLFDGANETWLEFHDMYYHLVYRNPKLSDEEKYYRLDAALIGEPAKYIRSLHYFEKSAYQTVWSVVKDKQNDQSHTIISHHRRAMASLQSVSSQSCSDLRQLLDAVAYHDSVLTRLGAPPKTKEYEVHLTLLMKLDNTSRAEYENRPKDAKRTSKELMAFVDRICKRLCIVDDDRI